jgi:hypothetical protein
MKPVVSMRLDDDVVARLDAVARGANRSRSAVADMLLRYGFWRLAQDPAKDDPYFRMTPTSPDPLTRVLWSNREVRDRVRTLLQSGNNAAHSGQVEQKSETDSENFGTRLPPHLADFVRRYAWENATSESSIIRMAVKRFYDTQEASGNPIRLSGHNKE